MSTESPTDTQSPTRNNGRTKKTNVSIKSPAAKPSKPSTDDFTELSKEELLNMMKEEDKRVRNLQEQIRRVKMEAVERKLREAELKKFNPAERDKIKDAFDLFDKNNSGMIELSELLSLSKELGYEMTEKEGKEAMANLDTDKNGNLCFDEFLLWWGSSSERGGNKGIKLDLMKAKIRGEILQKELRLHVEQHANKRTGPRDNSSQTFTANATIGAESGGECKTGMEFLMLPSDPIFFREERERLLPDHPITVLDLSGVEVQMRYIIVVSFAMQKDKDIDEIQSVIDGINDAFADFNGSAHTIVASLDEDKKLRFTIFLRRTDDPVSDITNLFLNDDNPDYSGANLFTIVSILLQTQQNGEDYLAWDCEAPILDMLDQASLHAHVKMSSDINSYLESYLFGSSLLDDGLQDDSDQREMIMKSVLGRLFNSAEIEIHSNSSREAVQQVVDGLASFPLKLAAKRGIFSDELNFECAELKNKFKLQLDSLFKTEMTVSALMAKVVVRMLDLEEYTTAVTGLGQICLAIDSVNVIHPMFTARLSIKGLPFFKYLFQEDAEEMMMLVLEKRKAKKIFVGDDSFPHSTKVLDKADDQFGRAFRAIISGGNSDSDSDSNY